MKPKQSGPDVSDPSGGGWIFPVLLLAVLLALVGIAKWNSNPQVVVTPKLTQNWTPSVQPTGETVSLEIDYGNGAKRLYADLPWVPEMTVSELMQAARQFGPAIEFTQVGEGASGFLSSLDGLANQGAAGRNWIFKIDGQHAHSSFCLEKLPSGGHVLWSFTDELYNGTND